MRLILSLLFALVGLCGSAAVVEPTGTLPIVYINTDNGAPIVDKVTNIPAGLWIDIPEQCSDKDWSLGCEAEPVRLEIRGRGNSSWQAPKKPYKLKFTSKTAVMGLPKSKHYVLLAGYGWYLSWAANAAAFDAAKVIDVSWTPSYRPVEVVLNGSYEGMYLLYESIKIDKNRLNIYEQPELNEDESTIPYGWLVEIDNTVDEEQIIVPDKPGYEMRVTHKSPGELSKAQEDWLIGNFTDICATIQGTPQEREHWTDYIDATSLVRLFIIRELFYDTDGFNGSFYLYRDKEENAIWKAGPIWDVGIFNTDDRKCWTYEDLPGYSRWKLIPDLVKTKAFQDAFIREWDIFYPEKFNQLRDGIVALAEKCELADKRDKQRWDLDKPTATAGWGGWLFSWLGRSAEWIDAHKGAVSSIISVVPEAERGETEWFNLQGQKLSGKPTAPGAYIRIDNREAAKVIIR